MDWNLVLSIGAAVVVMAAWILGGIWLSNRLSKARSPRK